MYKYLLLIIALEFTCWLACKNPFAPSLADENTPRAGLLTQQKTPLEVLSNFQYAYTFEDSLVYSEVLDSAFIFRSTDFNSYPPKPIEWGRDTELRTTAGMFRYFNKLDVVWNSISDADTVDIPDSDQNKTGFIIEHNVTFTLTLDGGKAIPPLNGEVIFRFIQRDDKYLISFWEDLRI